MASALEQVLSRLERVRRVGNGWMARCPAHEDRSPSLKVAVGDDGRVLLNCKVGCRTESVLDEIGLAWRDLFEVNPSLPPRQVPVAKRYDRNSESSSPLARELDEVYLDSGEVLYHWGFPQRAIPMPRTHVIFDEHGEVVSYQLDSDRRKNLAIIEELRDVS